MSLNQFPQPKAYHVTVTRSAKGKYQWEISVHSDSEGEVLAMVSRLEGDLRRQYQGQLSGEDS